MSLPPRGTGLQKGLSRTDRGYGVPLTEEERLTRHSEVGVRALPSNLTVWWNGLATWQKALVVMASAGGVVGGASVLGGASLRRKVTFWK